jgi:hypothetical protein
MLQNVRVSLAIAEVVVSAFDATVASRIGFLPLPKVSTTQAIAIATTRDAHRALIKLSLLHGLQCEDVKELAIWSGGITSKPAIASSLDRVFSNL